MDQTNIFEFIYPKYHCTKPIRLIELFAGYGSQALALKYLGVPFEHWKICEWNYKSFHAYKLLHSSDDTDYSKGLSKDELVEYLAKKGVSADWNKPMKLEQIKRLGEGSLREIYNNIQATHNLVDVSQVHGNDLEIINPDQYTYIMTYSFPCQDLSLAGLRQGMNRGEETRSGLLWEVERILHELQADGNLPDILLMENVPQVHGVGNEDNFREWQLVLERMGYSNYWQDLIATDYGIPQIRNRCFMVSMFGEYNYNFPLAVPLKWRLKDLLEKEVDEKYYLSERAINGMLKHTEEQKAKGNGFKFEPTDGRGRAKTITVAAGNRCDDNYIQETDVMITTSKKHAATMIFPDSAMTCKTIDTRVGDTCHWEQYIVDEPTYIEIKRPHGYFPGSIKETDTISTIDSSIDFQHIVLGEKLQIKNATKQGYLEAEDGDGIDISARMEYHRGTVQKGLSQTLSCQGGENQGVIVNDKR